MQVVQQLGPVHVPATAAAVDSTRGADHSVAGMEESENATCQQQQQQQHQHVTDQLGNLSMHQGQSACVLGVLCCLCLCWV